MKIVVSGGQGLLGRTFEEYLAKDERYTAVALGKFDLDITKEKSVRAVLENIRPDWLINCAAFTNVDEAEVYREMAIKINGTALSTISAVARELKIKVLHVSTDYVFDGVTIRPYSEDSATNPINQYGISKLQGERNLLESMPENALIVRTAWLYGSLKSGFLSQVIGKIQKGEKIIQLVNDQVGQLTLASDVVDASMKIVNSYERFESKVLHITNQEFGSWKDIGEQVNSRLNGKCVIEGISHTELGRLANRPPFSALDSKCFANEFGPLRTWSEALDEFLGKYEKVRVG